MLHVQCPQAKATGLVNTGLTADTAALAGATNGCNADLLTASKDEDLVF